MFKEVRIQTTTLCNGMCKICPHPILYRSIYRKMDDATWNRVLLEIQKHDVLVNFGLHCEPFMDPTITKKIREVTNLGKRVIIITNGNCIPEEFYKEHKDNRNIFMRVSILSPLMEEYEERTGLKYSKVSNTINKLMATQFNTEILYTAKYSVDQLRLKNYFRGVPYTFQVQDSRGGFFEEETKIKKKNTVGYGSYCQQLEDAIHIMHDGRYIICCQDWTRESEEKNIFNNNFIEYYTSLSSKRDKIREGIYPFKKCIFCKREFGFE